MQINESIALAIPTHLLPAVQDLVDDCDTESFDECLMFSSQSAGEQLSSALMDYPRGHRRRAEAIAEMHRFLELVEFSEAT